MTPDLSLILRRSGVLGALLALPCLVGGAVLGPSAASAETAASTAPTAVVELFQSQGCSSCPPANANVLALADQPGVLALSFQVVYWDDLGWKDTFASKATTQRQYDYAKGLHRANVATPEVVINGHADLVGVDARELGRAVAAAALPTERPALTLSDQNVVVGQSRAPAEGADVWLVRYDPHLVQVAIRRGENSGRTLPHRNVVHELVRLGAWRGAAQSYALPAAKDPAWKTAILVQKPEGGALLAAATNPS